MGRVLNNVLLGGCAFPQGFGWPISLLTLVSRKPCTEYECSASFIFDTCDRHVCQISALPHLLLGTCVFSNLKGLSMQKLSKGDIVQLNSGGPLMEVCSAENGNVEVEWITREVFPVQSIRKVNLPSAIQESSRRHL